MYIYIREHSDVPLYHTLEPIYFFQPSQIEQVHVRHDQQYKTDTHAFASQMATFFRDVRLLIKFCSAIFIFRGEASNDVL